MWLSLKPVKLTKTTEKMSDDDEHVSVEGDGNDDDNKSNFTKVTYAYKQHVPRETPEVIII